MPRYHFNVHDGRRIVDREGTELPDADAARSEALQASGEMLKNFARESVWTGQDWRMDVTDQDGNAVGTIRLSAEAPDRTREPSSTP